MKLKSILNLMTDDKFLDYYINMSENVKKNKSDYLVFSEDLRLNKIQYRGDNLKVFKKNRDSYNNLLKWLNGSETLIFHSFNSSMKDFIFSLPNSIRKIWIFWGSEGYAALSISSLINFYSFRASLANKNIFRSYMTWWRLKLPTRRNMRFRKIISQMDFCATWIDGDFELAKKFNPEIRKVYFNYFTTELMMLQNLGSKNGELKHLFLGNSADPTNNHVEALKYLKEINFKGNIICPLSYGGSITYVNNVCLLGNELFGNNFIPILEFLQLHEYQKIIDSCGIVWMNHKRQQAAGNLLASFASKKVVILDSKNRMIETFKKWDLKFYDKSILKRNHEINESDLTSNKIKILREVNIDRNKDFFELIFVK